MDDLVPKEKIVKYGLKSLTNFELLSIIIEDYKKGALTHSKEICQKYSLPQIQKMSPSQLMKEFGLSLSGSCKILSSFELGERSKVKKEKETTIRCAEDISNLLLPQVQSLNQEYLFVLYLNTRKKVLSEKTLFIGSLNESLVNPREIFKRGLEINASAVIVAHNHPSGNPSPSEADINSTKELIEVGKLMGIEVLDHVILGKNTYWSLAENGLI